MPTRRASPARRREREVLTATLDDVTTAGSAGAAVTAERRVPGSTPVRARATPRGQDGPPDPAPAAGRSGGWREGDPEGDRRWYELPGPLDLDSGQTLPGARLAYETFGRLAPDGSNAVLVQHALTADSHLAGPAGPGHPSPGWWDQLVRAGAALDPARWFVVVPNAIGGCQGSTGPASTAPDGRVWGARFPRLAMPDLVRAESGLLDHLGVPAWAAVVGGSMGGMRALQWAVQEPERVRRLFLLACPPVTGADAIGSITTQVLAVTGDPAWQGGDYDRETPGPVAGLGLARRIAHLSYRSARELDVRFGRTPQAGEDPRGDQGRYAVQSYLDHHAGKLARRFDAGSYVALCRTMLDFDVAAPFGGGDDGLARALARVGAVTGVAGIDSDRLFPLDGQHRLAEGIAGAGPVDVVSSDFGHDGFLIETPQVDPLLAALLARDA